MPLAGAEVVTGFLVDEGDAFLFDTFSPTLKHLDNSAAARFVKLNSVAISVVPISNLKKVFKPTIKQSSVLLLDLSELF